MPTAVARTAPSSAAPHASATEKSGASIRVNNFDLIRLLAALQVVASHGSDFLNAPLWHPMMVVLGFLPGVPIFFVVSGFLISLSWERAPSARLYVRNRMLRIYPGLWVCLLVSIAIFLSAGVRPDSLTHFVTWVAAQATVVQFYNPVFLRSFGIGVLNGSLWTIPVELQFYLLLPFLAVVTQRRPERWIALTLGAGIVMMLARIELPAHESMLQKLLGVSIIPYLFYFLVGILMRHLYERRPNIFVQRGMFWATVYALWAIIETRYSIIGANGNLLNVTSIVLIAMLTVSMAFTARGVSSRVLRGNDISYGLYIYHAPVMNLLIAHQFAGRRAFALFLATTIAMAILSWRLVEKPALSLKDYSIRPTQ